MAAESPSSPPMQHYPAAQTTFNPPLIANENAYLGDIFSSATPSTTAPLTCGLFRLAPGTPLAYTYTYDEMKIVVEGSMTIADEAGNKVEAMKGDVFFFPKGCRVRFETAEGGLAFFTGARGMGEA